MYSVIADFSSPTSLDEISEKQQNLIQAIENLKNIKKTYDTAKKTSEILNVSSQTNQKEPLNRTTLSQQKNKAEVEVLQETQIPFLETRVKSESSTEMIQLQIEHHNKKLEQEKKQFEYSKAIFLRHALACIYHPFANPSDFFEILSAILLDTSELQTFKRLFNNTEGLSASSFSFSKLSIDFSVPTNATFISSPFLQTTTDSSPKLKLEEYLEKNDVELLKQKFCRVWVTSSENTTNHDFPTIFQIFSSLQNFLNNQPKGAQGKPETVGKILDLMTHWNPSLETDATVIQKILDLVNETDQGIANRFKNLAGIRQDNTKKLYATIKSKCEACLTNHQKTCSLNPGNPTTLLGESSTITPSANLNTQTTSEQRLSVSNIHSSPTSVKTLSPYSGMFHQFDIISTLANLTQPNYPQNEEMVFFDDVSEQSFLQNFVGSSIPDADYLLFEGLTPVLELYLKNQVFFGYHPSPYVFNCGTQKIETLLLEEITHVCSHLQFNSVIHLALLGENLPGFLRILKHFHLDIGDDFILVKTKKRARTDESTSLANLNVSKEINENNISFVMETGLSAQTQIAVQEQKKAEETFELKRISIKEFIANYLPQNSKQNFETHFQNRKNYHCAELKLKYLTPVQKPRPIKANLIKNTIQLYINLNVIFTTLSNTLLQEQQKSYIEFIKEYLQKIYETLDSCFKKIASQVDNNYYQYSIVLVQILDLISLTEEILMSKNNSDQVKETEFDVKQPSQITTYSNELDQFNGLKNKVESFLLRLLFLNNVTLTFMTFINQYQEREKKTETTKEFFLFLDCFVLKSPKKNYCEKIQTSPKIKKINSPLVINKNLFFQTSLNTESKKFSHPQPQDQNTSSINADRAIFKIAHNSSPAVVNTMIKLLNESLEKSPLTRGEASITLYRELLKILNNMKCSLPQAYQVATVLNMSEIDKTSVNITRSPFDGSVSSGYAAFDPFTQDSDTESESNDENEEELSTIKNLAF